MQKREEGPTRPTSTSTPGRWLRIRNGGPPRHGGGRKLSAARRSSITRTPHKSTMASTSAPWQWPVPRPLQQLFDSFPLVTYAATELPARSQPATSDSVPTLYVFASEADARLGAPSFNPGCLKWQTFLRLAGVTFRILPSTNHASPTGALPFLLPARPNTTPIPATKLHTYALQHGTCPPSEPSTLRLDAYHSLLDLPLRNAWLHALYLNPAHTSLLDTFYTAPASSSPWIRDALRLQLRRAAEAEILKTGSYLSAAAAGTAVVDGKQVYEGAREALEALAALLAESETGWFFGAQRPTLFDAGVFAFTYLMVRYMDGEGGLGGMVKGAGDGELEGHRRRVLEAARWGGEK
ncbi:hypothetical protein B0T16DRAFT_233959 [Cercophora newfieldiana]|uniref:Thioredoxin-like fold domain-containing protein n=1 Tax=Cercophora newfieldiana TaxID=92897 RepID=A0AA40CHC4_9PEZI|nr:hypothetical protein B0T16DRAFT_233959 [Cercophora newfieldiana]